MSFKNENPMRWLKRKRKGSEEEERERKTRKFRDGKKEIKPLSLLWFHILI